MCDNRSEFTDFKEKFSSERRTPEICFLPNVTPNILEDIRKEDVGQPNVSVTLARTIVQSATFSLTLPHFLLKTQCTLASFFITESAFLNLGFPYFFVLPHIFCYSVGLASVSVSVSWVCAFLKRLFFTELF